MDFDLLGFYFLCKILMEFVWENKNPLWVLFGIYFCAGLLAGVRGRCKGRVMKGVQSTSQVADFVVPPWCCRQGVGGSVTRQGVGGVPDRKPLVSVCAYG